MTTPDCGTCARRECPDHGQPHMRTVLEEECIMRQTGDPLRELLEGCEKVPLEVDFMRRAGEVAAAAMAIGLVRQHDYSTRRNVITVAITDYGRAWLEARRDGERYRRLIKANVKVVCSQVAPAIITGFSWDGEAIDTLAAGLGECPTCHGSGEVIVCVDDMCRAAGRCLHGDGERPCPDCQE